MKELVVKHPIKLAGDGKISCVSPDDITINIKELKGILKAISSGCSIWSNGDVTITIE